MLFVVAIVKYIASISKYKFGDLFKISIPAKMCNNSDNA